MQPILGKEHQFGLNEDCSDLICNWCEQNRVEGRYNR